MFWHEQQENEVNIFPYNKADFLKLTSSKNKDNEKELNRMDSSDNFQIDTIVSTDWGPGKIVSVNKIEKKVIVKIEGEEKEFNMHDLRTTSQILIMIFFKNLNFIDKKLMFSTIISAGETILDIKKKIANILGTRDNCVTLVLGGEKLTNNNKRCSEIRFYQQDIMLAVVNGLCDY